MILSSALRTSAAAPRADTTWTPLDERWYSSTLGNFGDNEIGLSLSADTIFRCGTVLAAIRFKAEAVAVCTPQAFKRLGDGRRERAPQHPAEQTLRHPNAWQTGFEWTHLNVVRVSTWGNAYNRIVRGPRYFAEELRPLHPAHVRVLSQSADGSLVYEYRPPSAERELLSQDEVLHYRGFSLDGFSGVAMYQLIRNTVGIALLAEKHTGSFLAKGSRLAGLLVPQAPTGADKRKELKDSWNESFGGPDKTGTVGLLPFGVDFKAIASDNQKGQVLELTNQQVESILRFLGVPGVVVGYQGDKASTYASADAFFEKGGIKHCIQPLVMNMEQRDEHALLVQGDTFYLKRNLDVLQRANTKERIGMLVQAAGGPIMTRNEARAIEDLNAINDPDMDKVLEPGNMGPTGDPDPEPAPAPPRRPAPKPAPPSDEDSAMARRARRFATDAAARVVRREIGWIKGSNGTRGAAVRFASDPAAWKAQVTEFYEKHAAYVLEALHLDARAALEYSIGQRDALLAGGVAIVESWEETVVPELAALSLEGEPAAPPPAIAPAAAPVPTIVNAEIHVPPAPPQTIRVEPTIIVERPAPVAPKARRVTVERDPKTGVLTALTEEA